MIFYRPIDDVQINFPLYRYPSVGFEFQNETLINVFSSWWLFAIISHIFIEIISERLSINKKDPQHNIEKNKKALLLCDLA